MNLQELTASAIRRELSEEQINALSFEDFKSVVMAYVESEVKKFNQFAMIYKTNTNARKAFQLKVLNDLK